MPPKKKPDHYLGTPGPDTITINGKDYAVTVHWAVVDGRAVPVGLDLRSFTQAKGKTEPLGGRFREVTSPVLRGLRLAEAVEQSRRDMDLLGQMLKHYAPTPVGRVAGRRTVRAVSEPERRRGPQPRLSIADLREVVVPAYRAGGSRPIEAVRLALEAHLDERVTKEQARNAVKRARAEGLEMPQYRRPNEQEGTA